jgi:predicted regulator of Ras-like GTPase activity (Roadblock/LC7/MglB family)
MSASMTFLLLVITGAILFFAAGYLFRLLLSSEKGRSKRSVIDEIDQMERRLATAEEKERRLSGSLSIAEAESQDQEEELKRLRAENAQLLTEKQNLLEEIAENKAAAFPPEKEAFEEFEVIGEIEKELEETREREKELEAARKRERALDKEISDLKRAVGDAQKKENRAKVSLEISKEEVRKLKKEVGFLKKSEASTEAKTRKLEEMGEKLKVAEEKISGMSKLEKENRYLRKEVQLLSIQASSGKGKPRTKSPASPTTTQLKQTFDSDMREIVQDLLEMDQVHSAVVADVEGILIGGVGDEDVFEGLAELCGRVGNIGQDIEKTIPLSGLRVAHLKDNKDGVAAFRTFKKNNQVFVLGTIGKNTPPGEGILELTVGDLSNDI